MATGKNPNCEPGTAGGYWTAEEEAILAEAMQPDKINKAVVSRARANGFAYRSPTAVLQHIYTIRYRAESEIEKREKAAALQAEMERIANLPTERIDRHLIGWRIWEARPAGLFAFLESLVTRTIWPAGEPLVAHGVVTTMNDNVGIYAFDHRRTPEQYEVDYHVDPEIDRKMLVRGSVALWGKILVCEAGYRAEFAYPDVVIVQNEKLAQALRRTYGCEVVVGPWKGFGGKAEP
jgi:hypothetical protein